LVPDDPLKEDMIAVPDEMLHELSAIMLISILTSMLYHPYSVDIPKLPFCAIFQLHPNFGSPHSFIFETAIIV
jgi:hypothetical protein